MLYLEAAMRDFDQIAGGFCSLPSAESTSLENSTSAGAETRDAAYVELDEAGNRFGQRRSNRMTRARAVNCNGELSQRASRIAPCPALVETQLGAACGHSIGSRFATFGSSWPLGHEARTTPPFPQNDLAQTRNRNRVNS